MAKEEQVVSVNQLADAFSAAMKSVQPRVELKEGDPEYVERQRKEGWFDDFFGTTVFQNAYEAQARGIPEEVRQRVGLLKPGKYIKNRVTVEVMGNSTPTGRAEIVRLLYPVSGTNDALINQTHFSSFEDLVTKIWDEMHATVAA